MILHDSRGGALPLGDYFVTCRVTGFAERSGPAGGRHGFWRQGRSLIVKMVYNDMFIRCVIFVFITVTRVFCVRSFQ